MERHVGPIFDKLRSGSEKNRPDLQKSAVQRSFLVWGQFFKWKRNAKNNKSQVGPTIVPCKPGLTNINLTSINFIILLNSPQDGDPGGTPTETGRGMLVGNFENNS